MNDDNVKAATVEFLQSKYGKHVMGLLEEMYISRMANAESFNSDEPVRHLDRAVAVKECIQMIKSPLE